MTEPKRKVPTGTKLSNGHEDGEEIRAHENPEIDFTETQKEAYLEKDREPHLHPDEIKSSAVNNDMTVSAGVVEEEPDDGVRFDYQPVTNGQAPNGSDSSGGSDDGEMPIDFLTEALRDYLSSDPVEEFTFELTTQEAEAIGDYSDQVPEQELVTDGSELGIVNRNFHSTYVPDKVGFDQVGSPEEIVRKLAQVGYQCDPFIAAQMSLLLNTQIDSVRGILLEGPTGCGKSFMAKSLAKITGADFMCLQCYRGMKLENLIEFPSTLAMVNAMTGSGNMRAEDTMNLGVLARAFLKSQEKPVILLVDEIDKVDTAVDTFFLGPIQDARVWLESSDPIDCNPDNLLIIFTKNFERPLNDALLRRLQPTSMDYMSSALEEKVLSPHCAPQLVKNLVRIADIMRFSDGSYPFERPPAPEELLRTGKYVGQLLKWDIRDYSFVGRNVWYMLAKSEHDRAVFEQLLRYHPDFFDPLVPDGRKASMSEIFARLGRMVLREIVKDPDEERRGTAYQPEKIGLVKVGDPDELTRRLGDVGYISGPFLATQVSLLLRSPTDRVRSLLLEGPSGCGKSFLAKCLSKITGAHFMCLSCYKDMNTQHLIEVPSALAIAKSSASGEETAKEKLMNLGILSKAFLKSQSQPTILLIDEIDKVDSHVDTFFLGPIQDGRIWLESRPPIDANLDDLLIVFTKNMERELNSALLRRLHPIRMNYLDSSLEEKILSKHCVPQLVENLVGVADRMRYSDGSYEFERPPAPEELLTSGHYIAQMLEWGIRDFKTIGKNVWAILAKSPHDRAVLEHMMRYHPDFEDPLCLDGKNAPLEEIYARLGRWVVRGVVEDPDEARREEAWQNLDWN